jgi:hypothetical protein
MLKYLAKISMDIFPSVLATIIGAYIVNHYINAKPAADTPAAVMAPAQAGKPADTAALPGPGIKAKGISEKSVTTKAAEKPAEKHVDQPTEAKASDPAETGAHGRLPSREKTLAKSAPAPTTPATVPTVEASSAAPATNAAPDANDLARAAIERLRKSPENKAAEAKAVETKAVETKPVETKPVETKAVETKAVEAKSAERLPEFATQDAARVGTPSAVRPLPPPITVSTPAAETYGNNPSPQAGPSYTASVGNDDPNRLTPPADIPVPVIAPPLDLRADAGASMPKPKTNVADEMLSGMKSMFHAVLPKSATPD